MRAAASESRSTKLSAGYGKIKAAQRSCRIVTLVLGVMIACLFSSTSAWAAQSVTYTVAKVVCVRAGEPCSAPPPPPNTVLGSHPKKTIKTVKQKIKVKFTFSSSAAGASFKCKLDQGAFTPCVSPKTYKVKRGKHTFSVEAVSAGGTDPSPASFAFSVKKKSRACGLCRFSRASRQSLLSKVS